MDEPLSGTLLTPAAAASRAKIAVTADGRTVDVPAPMAASVGDIAGLSPKRKRGDGGEVPGADVDLVDALPRDLVWPTVAAWLTTGKSVATRRARLADLAAFLRWLDAHAPGLALLAVTEDTVTGYRESIAAGTARAGVKIPGKPLAAASVARRLSSLASFYAYAVRRAGLTRNPADAALVERPEVSGAGKTPARTRTEAQNLLAAAESRSFAEQHPMDAAAVALLLMCALRVGELASLTAGQVRIDAGHTVLVFTRKGGKTDRVPVPPDALALLRPLLDGRPKDALVFAHEDGRPWNRWRFTTALRRTAHAAGIDPARLTPHTARTTAATELLDEGVPIEVVQTLLGHASPVTTQRYDRGTRRLSGHGAYRLAALFTDHTPSSGQ
ncbi:tyrosine-type recombinase/integrase [Actinocorallia sp. B10E7]|uniref:tyrosine-type recombinase/integrase n=1 Tax=Actinocorallia sp. B10E7 TaxID=3153558 RepID=UPI00325D6539